MLCIRGTSLGPVSVCLSVTSRLLRWKMSISQNAMLLCGWEVEVEWLIPSRVNVWATNKQNVHSILSVLEMSIAFSEPIKCYTNFRFTLLYPTNYSPLISFFRWCLTHLGVGEVGQPFSVLCQYEQTEASRLKAWRSGLLLPESGQGSLTQYSIK